MVAKSKFFFLLLVCLPFSAFAFTPTSDDLVSYWSCDETSGSRVDSHGTNDLTDNNTVGYVEGVIGNACYFNGANSEYLSINDASQSGLDDDVDYSLSFWLHEQGSGTRGLFMKGAYPNDDSWSLFVRASASGNYDPRLSGTRGLWTLTATGEFHHIVAVFERGQPFVVYKDGSLVDSDATVPDAVRDSTYPVLS